MSKVTVIKKSPVVIVKNFIILQSVAGASFFVASALANYASIYRSLGISQAVSFSIVQALFIFLAETGMVFFIFFRWHRESYQIRNNEIIHSYGLLYRHKTAIPLDNILSISHHQSPLGKLTKYGTIELTANNTNKKIMLNNIPSPEEYVHLILRAKRRLANGTKEISGNNILQTNLADLLNKNEHENLEFKSSLRWDMRQNAVNRILEKSVMKTVVGFLNSEGGHLVLGVDDTKKIIGLASDFNSLARKDADGFENHFTNIFHSMIGAEFRQFVKLNWSKIEDKECCLVRVYPGHKPAYLKSDNGEEFYIRTGNGTTSLKLSEVSAYIDSRWGRV